MKTVFNIYFYITRKDDKSLIMSVSNELLAERLVDSLHKVTGIIGYGTFEYEQTEVIDEI